MNHGEIKQPPFSVMGDELYSGYLKINTKYKQNSCLRLGEQLALTYQQPDIFFNNQQQQQQQQQEQQQQQQHVLSQEQHTYSIQQQHHPYLNPPPPPPPPPPQQQQNVLHSPLMMRSHSQGLSGAILQHPQHQHNGMDVTFTDSVVMDSQYLTSE